MFVPIKAEEPEVRDASRASVAAGQEPHDKWRATRLLRALVVVSEIFVAEEERLVIEVEGEGTSVPPPPNRPEWKVSPYMDHDEVCYVDSPLRSQEDFYREAQARCPDRSPWTAPPSGAGLTGFEQWLDRLDEPPEPEEFYRPCS